MASLIERLIREGDLLLERPLEPIAFTGNPDGDRLLNDLERHPHAFLFGCLVDRQVPAERAWILPYEVSQRLGSLEMSALRGLSDDDWLKLLSDPSPLHRFPPTMATTLRRAVERLQVKYESNAARIWSDEPSSATVVRRFLEFHGAGPKIATMAANILVRHFHIKLRDRQYIDISADVHVRRVMERLGFVEPGASVDVVIYAAREASPTFPGVFDVVLWELGRTLCRPRNPNCGECRFHNDCTYQLKGPPFSTSAA